MEIKNCQNCKKDFILELEDFLFFKKINVPPPTFCPECRLIRRLAFRESRPLWKDNCDMCGINLVSIFSDDLGVTTYCNSCWWGDGWDGIEYGKDYDFTKTFFHQFQDLRIIVPREATGQKNNDNCEYSNGDVRCKDCTLTFDCFESINCYNSQVALLSRDSIDIDNTTNADHCYDSFGSNNLYNTKFVYFSNDCIDSSFLFNCVGCSNCFGCVNLRNQKYCLWNIQYTKKEYEEKIKELDLGSHQNIIKIREIFMDLYHKTPKRFALITNSSNVTGNDISNTSNCKNCFFTRQGVENCKNIFACGLLLKDSYDATFGGDRSEMFYEMNGGMQSQRCFFSRAPNNCHDMEYCERMINCSHCFGCVNLRNKKYCILNKQYTKDDYFKMIEKIKNQMMEMPYIDRKGRVYKYGEYFPIELSLWAYNESWGNKYLPLTRQKALDNGYNWRESQVKDYEITIRNGDILDHIKNIEDDVLNEIIECQHRDGDCGEECNQVFRILPNELHFYRQMNLALPRFCPNCRHYERLKFMNSIKLWHRKCMKEGCQNEFETPYSPEKNNIVYCEKCYQSEFI